MKLFDFVLPALGWVTERTTHPKATIAQVSDPVQIPEVHSKPVPAALEAPVVTGTQAIDKILSAKAFLAGEHQRDGETEGNWGHSDDLFEIGISAKATRFKASVKETMEQLEDDILRLNEDLIDAGQMSPARKAKIELNIKRLQAKLDHWTNQYGMQLIPTTDSDSEFVKVREEYRLGFEIGWKRFETEKRFGQDNGLNNLY